MMYPYISKLLDADGVCLLCHFPLHFLQRGDVWLNRDSRWLVGNGGQRQQCRQRAHVGQGCCHGGYEARDTEKENKAGANEKQAQQLVFFSRPGVSRRGITRLFFSTASKPLFNSLFTFLTIFLFVMPLQRNITKPV